MNDAFYELGVRHDYIHLSVVLPRIVVPMHKLVSIIKHWHIDEGLLPPVPEVEILKNYAV